MRTILKSLAMATTVLFAISCDNQKSVFSKEQPDYQNAPLISGDSSKWISANIYFNSPKRYAYAPSISKKENKILAWTLEVGDTGSLGLGRARWFYLNEYSPDFNNYRSIKIVIQYPETGRQTISDTPDAKWRPTNDDMSSSMEWAIAVKRYCDNNAIR